MTNTKWMKQKSVHTLSLRYASSNNDFSRSNDEDRTRWKRRKEKKCIRMKKDGEKQEIPSKFAFSHHYICQTIRYRSRTHNKLVAHFKCKFTSERSLSLVPFSDENRFRASESWLNTWNGVSLVFIAIQEEKKRFSSL